VTPPPKSAESLVPLHVLTGDGPHALLSKSTSHIRDHFPVDRVADPILLQGTLKGLTACDGPDRLFGDFGGCPLDTFPTDALGDLSLNRIRDMVEAIIGSGLGCSPLDPLSPSSLGCFTGCDPERLPTSLPSYSSTDNPAEEVQGIDGTLDNSRTYTSEGHGHTLLVLVHQRSHGVGCSLRAILVHRLDDLGPKGHRVILRPSNPIDCLIPDSLVIPVGSGPRFLGFKEGPSIGDPQGILCQILLGLNRLLLAVEPADFPHRLGITGSSRPLIGIRGIARVYLDDLRDFGNCSLITSLLGCCEGLLVLLDRNRPRARALALRLCRYRLLCS
jgi:hypothetical protein